jgi:hypothetical protein
MGHNKIKVEQKIFTTYFIFPSENKDDYPSLAGISNCINLLLSLKVAGEY